jgi:hypothetical protein
MITPSTAPPAYPATAPATAPIVSARTTSSTASGIVTLAPRITLLKTSRPRPSVPNQ